MQKYHGDTRNLKHSPYRMRWSPLYHTLALAICYMKTVEFRTKLISFACIDAQFTSTACRRKGGGGTWGHASSSVDQRTKRKMGIGDCIVYMLVHITQSLVVTFIMCKHNYEPLCSLVLVV